MKAPPVRWSAAVLAAWTLVVVAAPVGASLVATHVPRSGSNVSFVAPEGGVALDPTRFAPGSCVAFEPTYGNVHRTVFLDAGHGGVDPGAVGVTISHTTVKEADLTLPVELLAMARLRAHGYRVVVSRTGSSTVARMGAGDLSGGIFTVDGEHADVIARPACADIARANILIGIYFDAADSPDAVGSLTAYDAARPFATSSRRLAGLVQQNVLSLLDAHGMRIPNVGVLTDAGLGGVPPSRAAARYGHLLLLGPADPGYLSTPSQMPGALIEPLFLSNRFEATLAAEPQVQRLIAEGIAAAVERYFGAPIARNRG